MRAKPVVCVLAIVLALGIAVAAAGGRPSSITVSSSKHHAAIGDDIVLMATVAPLDPQGAPPTGDVTFTDGPDVIATVKLENIDGAMRARFVTGTLPEGAHQIIARYAGDEQFAPGESTPFAQFITAPQR